MSQQEIKEALDDIPSDSDISGASDDSDVDETWLPKGQRDVPDSDDDAGNVGDGGQLSDGGGDVEDNQLPDLDNSYVPQPSSSSSEPPKKRSCSRSVARPQWEWEKKDLPAREMPKSSVKPRNLDHCNFDVQFYLEMMGEDNIQLLTTQSNIMRVQQGIQRNKTAPPITEKEIRQWMGIHMYASVISMPASRMHWSKELRNGLVPAAMSRDRFKEISSYIHLSDNALQPARGDPDYDRLFKVRQFLSNLSAHFADLAEIEEILSVDEMMIPYKGRLALKVYMKNKPSKWGVKVFALAGQTGYVYRFNISGDKIIVEEEEVGIEVSGRTVLNLVRNIPPSSEVFFDNWFASPALLLKLK